MAIYIAGEILDGGLDYLAFFSIPRYTPFKADVDAILTAEGRQDLIVPIP